ncbi:MAG: tetratricopeptide repeat protein, partial [Candidatus Kapaibacterium sp.]
MEISPLFAIDAQKLLGAGDASGAVQLLEQGIEVFPEYTTAYAVMARAFMQMRDAESAYEWVKRGLKQAPTHRALVILEQELRRQTFSGTTTESNSVQQDPVEDSVAEHSHEPPHEPSHEPSHEAPPPSVPEEPIAHT